MIEKKIRCLINKIKYYDYMYYIESVSLISDEKYDNLKKELENLEKENPHLIFNDSPTYSIGFNPNFDLPLSTHNIPMLSLKNTYSLEEIYDYIEDLLPVVMEPKIDGISLSLSYESGILYKALLRGNGIEGENILDNLFFTKIPIFIENKNFLEIRGELYLNKKNFEIINKIKEEKKEKIFQNSRNATNAIIRNKKTDFLKFLDFQPYNVFGLDFQTQVEILEFLEKMKFSLQLHKLIYSKEEIINSLKLFENLNFDIDGIVFKTNNILLSKTLGNTIHHPRSAIAYKFKNEVYIATIIEILWQVSRNGRIIPIGKINEILIDNAKINKITLHNKKYLQEKFINIGSKIEIERVGFSVPQIKRVLETNKIYFELDFCPSCKEKVIEDKIHYFCKNKKCFEKKKQYFFYFCNQLNLKGLGKKNIKFLLESCEKISDIFLFIYNHKIYKYIYGWEKIRINIISIIKKINSISLLTAFGIDLLNKKSIEIILSFLKMNSLKELINFLQKKNLFKIKEEIKIKYLGKEKINSFFNFLEENKEEIILCIKNIFLFF